MLLAFAEKTLSGLVFSALVVGIASYFGQPFIFDPIVLIAIIAIAFFFRRNTDLLTICGAIIIERGIEELMWRFLENSIWFKIPMYLILVITCWFFSKGLSKVLLMLFFAFTIASELWWQIIDYKAPYILWQSYTLTAAVVLARYLKMRAFWLIEINHKWDVKPIYLDTQLIWVANAYILLYGFVVLEYFVRHIGGYKDVVVIYTLYPYIGSSLAIYALYMIIVQSVYHLKGLELDA